MAEWSCGKPVFPKQEPFLPYASGAPAGCLPQHFRRDVEFSIIKQWARPS